MKPRTCRIIKHINKYWGIADIEITNTVDDPTAPLEKYHVNYSYEITPDWIFTYEALGGSGYGYRRGSIINKIYIGDCRIITIERMELANGEIQDRVAE